MRMTLLDMVQKILSAMDSDEVSSINDTAESQQVVDQIETCFNDIISTIEFPEQWELFQLEETSALTPSLMLVPEGIAKVEWIKYEDGEGTEKNLRPVCPMGRQMFFNRMNALDTDRTEVFQFDFDNSEGEEFDVRGWNDRFPAYYTSTDNRSILFDSFDSDHGAYIPSERTQCYGMRIPVFVRSDSFVPPLEPRQFTLLFNEAKAQSFLDLKMVENVRAERKARRGWNFSQRKKKITDGSPIHYEYTPNFGRKGRRCR